MYYRRHGGDERGPFDEPPFEVFRHLGDSEWLARQPQHYVLAITWEGYKWGRNRDLNETIEPGRTVNCTLDMAPPAGGWRGNGRLRVQAEADLTDSEWTCVFNGQALEATEDRSEPYENPYTPLLGGPEHHRAWVVPSTLVKDGDNAMEFRLDKGPRAQLLFVDLAIR